MREDVRNKKGTQGSAFLDFLQKNALKIAIGIGLLIALLYALPFIKQLIDRIKVKNTESNLNTANLISNAQNNTSSPVIAQKKVEVIKKKYPKITNTKMMELQTNAQKMAIALGTNVEDNHVIFGGGLSFHNVSAWGEDEKSAVSIAKKHAGTFPVLAELYFSVYTKSRNLKTDLLKYLSKSQLEEIRESHKKNGGYKFL